MTARGTQKHKAQKKGINFFLKQLNTFYAAVSILKGN